MQKNNMNRVIVFIVTIIFLLTTVSKPVFSASPLWTGSGTANDPFVISNIGGLQALASDVNNGNSYFNTYFALGEDINLSTISNWTPIGGGTSTNPFSGNFDGRRHTISNMKITQTNPYGTKNFGLFGYTVNATISNVTLSNTRINFYISSVTTLCIGSFIGYDAGNTVVYNCGTSFGIFDIVKADNHSVVKVGGVIGSLASDSYIINCFNNVSITYHNGNRDQYYYGGISGFNTGTVYNCYYTGSICSENGDMVKANQDPISGNHEIAIPNYYDSTIYGSTTPEDASIPMTTEQMKTQECADMLNSNKDNLPPNFPVTPDQLEDWGVFTEEYPLFVLPSTTNNYNLNFSSYIGVNVNGETSSATLSEILSDAVPVTLDSITVSSALSGLIVGQIPVADSGKLAVALRYNGNDIFLTNGMTAGQNVISSSEQAPQITIVYYVDSQMETILNNEVITVTLKSTSNTATTYFVFNVKITTEQILVSGQALYSRGRQYDGISSSSENPIQADSCFTVQFLTNYNPYKMGHADTRHIILTSYSPFPAGTKFTLIDKTDTENSKYYYYISNSSTSFIDLNNFKIMGTVSGTGYQLPIFNEIKEENLIFVIDYSLTDKSAASSEIYLKHTINGSENDMLTTIPKVQSFIGTDSPSVSINCSDTTVSANEILQLQLCVTASHTKTIYDEQEYSVVLTTNNPLPYGTNVMMDSIIYNIEDGNKKVIIPVKTEGSYNITIAVSEYGYTEDFILTANLYSAPNAMYPFTMEEEPIITDTEHITILDSISAIKASLADNQRIIKEGSKTPLNFTVQAIDSNNVNKVRVTLYEKESDKGFNYTKTSTTDEFSIASGNAIWNYIPITSWKRGIYRFEFELLDGSGNEIKSTSVNAICF